MSQRTSHTETSISYFVVMIDYGRKGREAIVDPEMTYSNVVDRVRSGEYKNILFIHHIRMNEVPEDVTQAVMDDAAGLHLRKAVA